MAILSLSWSQEGDFSLYDCQWHRSERLPDWVSQAGIHPDGPKGLDWNS